MLKQKSILVIEHDRSVRELITMMMESEGYKVELANGNQDALKKIQSKKMDCVILDLLSPIGESLQNLRMLREGLGSNVPVLVLSAFNQIGIEEEALNAGASQFMTKPAEVKKIVRQIHRFVGG